MGNSQFNLLTTTLDFCKKIWPDKNAGSSSSKDEKLEEKSKYNRPCNYEMMPGMKLHGFCIKVANDAIYNVFWAYMMISLSVSKSESKELDII